MNRREEIEWFEVWITNAHAEGLPRLLFVGDSIVQSYYATVEAELRGNFHCARLATSKSVCDASFRRDLEFVLAEYRFAVIHFNNGLHGWNYSEPEYGASLAQIFDSLRPAAKVLWANTTPVRDAAMTARVRQRNQLARAAARDRQIPTNDLFSLVEAHPEYFADDGVHLQDAGRQALGQQVARFIQQQTSTV